MPIRVTLDEMLARRGMKARELAATVGKYVLDLEVVCHVLDPEDMANRIEYLPLT